MQNKGQCKDTTAQKSNILSCTFAKHFALTFVLIYCRLTLNYCLYICTVVAIRSVIMRSPTANMVAKYIVFSNIVTLPITGNVSVQGCVLFLYDEVKSAYTLILISIDTEPCRKNPIKTLTCHAKMSVPKRKLYWKNVLVKVSLESFVRNGLKENKLWNRTFETAFW